MTINERSKKTAYFALLALQVVGAATFILRELPEFRQVLQFPGVRPKDTRSDLITAGIFCGMQIPFWFRVFFVPIPFQRPNRLMSHIFLFLGVSRLFLGALYFRSSFSGIFQKWVVKPTCFWRSNVE
jgi:hypothetical protein